VGLIGGQLSQWEAAVAELGFVGGQSHGHKSVAGSGPRWRPLSVVGRELRKFLQKFNHAHDFHVTWPTSTADGSLLHGSCARRLSLARRSISRAHQSLSLPHLSPAPTRPSLSHSLVSPTGLSHVRLPVPPSLTC
jgi:hypothetical protein